MLTRTQTPATLGRASRRLLLRRFRRARTGATAIEYALIAGILSTFVVAGMTSLGSGLGASFDALIAKLAAALP